VMAQVEEEKKALAVFKEDNTWTPPLEDILKHIAKTNTTPHTWEEIKMLLHYKLDSIMSSNSNHRELISATETETTTTTITTVTTEMEKEMETSNNTSNSNPNSNSSSNSNLNSHSTSNSNLSLLSHFPSNSPILIPTFVTSFHQGLDTFTSFPFTCQRICELLVSPLSQQKSLVKYLRALDKMVNITSYEDIQTSSTST